MGAGASTSAAGSRPGSKQSSKPGNPPKRLSIIVKDMDAARQTAVEIAKGHKRPGLLSAGAKQWFVNRDTSTLAQAASFVPWVIQRGLKLGTVTDSNESVIVHRCYGAVVFSDASGFTALTERLARKPNGAELLSKCLNMFFTPLIDIINSYRGDVIKFSGDALTILFEAEDEEKGQACGSAWSGCPGHSALELAVLRASACCLEIHKRLHNFDTGEGVFLALHIGVGAGLCTILHLGGSVPPDTTMPRFEYVIAGQPLAQISIAEPLAHNGETVLSPEAWDLVKETVIDGEPLERPDFHKLTGLDVTKHTYATIKAAAQARDYRKRDWALSPEDLNVAKWYIPGAVFKHMENGTLQYVNEMRTVSVIFIQVSGVDVSTDAGSVIAQKLMNAVQVACNENEGQVNKFLVDDKGLLFLCVFGTPPMVHTDDPARAVLACFEILGTLKFLGLSGRFGVTTGRAFCGIVGSASRREYTTMGDSVNLSARLMANSQLNSILCDETTFRLVSESETYQDILEFEVLPAIKVKGKEAKIQIFKPIKLNKQSAAVAATSSSAVAENADDPQSPSFLAEAARAAQKSREDPLSEVESWYPGQAVKDIIRGSGLVRFGGIVVLAGQSGLGKEKLGDMIIQDAVKHDSYITYSSHYGKRREVDRPITEIFESALVALYGDASAPKGEAKLLALEEIVGFKISNLGVSPVTGMLEYVPPSTSGATANSSTLDAKLAATANNSKNSQSSESKSIKRLSLDDPDDRTTKRLSKFTRGQRLLLPGALLTEEDAESADPLSDLADVAATVVKKLLERRSVCLMMRISYGTSIYNVVPNDYFWQLFEILGDIVQSANAAAAAGLPGSKNRLSIVLKCKTVPKESAAGQFASKNGTAIELQPLNSDCLEEYCEKLLKCAPPVELLNFLKAITGGVPLYIRETIEQLTLIGAIEIQLAERKVEILKDLDQVNIAEWAHTSMAGRVICLLESLDPQAAAIVKMATVFNGPFGVLDLAASLASPYSAAVNFDNFRIWHTCQHLVERGILEAVETVNRDAAKDAFRKSKTRMTTGIAQGKNKKKLPIATAQPESESDGGQLGRSAADDDIRFQFMKNIFGPDTSNSFVGSIYKFPLFKLDNVIVRKIAAAMVLEQQRIGVKRQAMIQRALGKELKIRVTESKKRKTTLHVPYYELVQLS